MKRLLTICAVAAIVLAVCGTAKAAIISTTGAVDDSLSIPPDLTTGVFEDDIIFVFEEQQNLILSADLYVDITEPGTYAPPSPTLTPGTIESGTTVNSYIVHFDEEGGQRLTLSGSITFDSDILGVIVLTDSLDDSDSLVGAPGTTYDPIGNDPYHIVRGLDIFTHNQDPIILTVDYRTVSFTLTTLNGIDEIRIIEAPPQCVPPPSGLVAWWPGDGDADDIVGGNHGTLQGGATFAVGKVGQAFSFDGDDDYVIVPNDPIFDLTSQGSWTAWVKLDHHVETLVQHIVTVNQGGVPDARQWALEISMTNKLQMAIRKSDNSKWVSVTDSQDFPLNQWVFVAATYDNALSPSLNIYRDGNPVASNDDYQGVINTGTGSELRISSDVWEFNGLIDEVEIYNRALSQSEIQDIYNAGSAGKCKPIKVDIDIKPGSYPNAINLGSQGLIPVAILSSVDFDATTVDPDTVELAGADVAVRGKSNKYMAHKEDVNEDGLLDLVCQVATANLDPDSLQDGYAILTGNLLEEFGGTAIEGWDEIIIVPPEK